MSAPCPVFGFIVTLRLRDPKPGDVARAMTNDLIETLEANGLIVDRGHRALEFVVTREGSQATDADRQFVADWSARWEHAAVITLSDLLDLNQTAR